MPFRRSIVTFVLAFSTLMLTAHCADVDDPWQALKHLPRIVGFVFVEHDMTCQYGQIKAVTDQNVLIRTDRSDVTIEKSNLIRVRLGFGGRSVPPNNRNLVLATVYSGRSSWSDLIEFMPFQSESQSGFIVRMSVTTTGGKLHRGSLGRVTDSGISLTDAFAKEISIPKTEVSRIDYIRDKPLSDREEFHWDELAMLRIFDPVLYPRLFHLGDKMPVRLYNSDVPEDNSPVQCGK
jgi:hypothetical protein